MQSTFYIYKLERLSDMSTRPIGVLWVFRLSLVVALDRSSPCDETKSLSYVYTYDIQVPYLS